MGTRLWEPGLATRVTVFGAGPVLVRYLNQGGRELPTPAVGMYGLPDDDYYALDEPRIEGPVSTRFTATAAG